MGDVEKTVKSKIEFAGLVGPLWCIGWLFTVGFAGLSFWRAVLALILWPYYLGSALG
jgi:hypothetical protein